MSCLRHSLAARSVGAVMDRSARPCSTGGTDIDNMEMTCRCVRCGHGSKSHFGNRTVATYFYFY